MVVVRGDVAGALTGMVASTVFRPETRVQEDVNVPSEVGWPLLVSGVRVRERFPSVKVAVPVLGNVSDGYVPVASTVNPPEAGTGVAGRVYGT